MDEADDARPVGAFSDGYEELPLKAIIAGRAEPFADDLLAIRDLKERYEARLKRLSRSGLNRMVNRREIDLLKERLSPLGTAEIVSREKIRADAEKTRQLDRLVEQRQAVAVKQAPRPAVPADGMPSPADTPRRAPQFDRAAFLESESKARARVPMKAGEDDDED